VDLKDFEQVFHRDFPTYDVRLEEQGAAVSGHSYSVISFVGN